MLSCITILSAIATTIAAAGAGTCLWGPRNASLLIQADCSAGDAETITVPGATVVALTMTFQGPGPATEWFANTTSFTATVQVFGDSPNIRDNRDGPYNVPSGSRRYEGTVGGDYYAPSDADEGASDGFYDSGNGGHWRDTGNYGFPGGDEPYSSEGDHSGGLTGDEDWSGANDIP
ncbi:hypothetical protein ACHHYP_09662 [Achlya hypogyna]|uniref:Secreted protein n=1 Tax=Achlya hypogyna TaxID=1202772 RepID=A0A1V9YMR2_ACHHY|nr:hypothetical protein ACHHYP_09662 [Achlya hypogyna]